MKTMLMTFLLIYYGWPSSFNYDTNGWSTENVANDMAQYEMIVLGNGLQDSTHGDHLNTQTIIDRIKEINPNTKIFGYVSVNNTLTDFEAAAADWNDMGVAGIFMDEAGYDFGTLATNGRDAFNDKADFIHSLSDANLCFANAWNMDDVLGLLTHVKNPNLNETHLNSNDWYLMENFGVMNSTLETQSQFVSRGQKIKNYNINVASISIINNTASNGQDLFDFSFLCSFIYDVNVHGSSDVYYGASSATVTLWDRPDVLGLGPKVKTKRTTNYLNYDFNKRITVDFSDGSIIINK